MLVEGFVLAFCRISSVIFVILLFLLYLSSIVNVPRLALP